MSSWDSWAIQRIGEWIPCGGTDDGGPRLGCWTRNGLVADELTVECIECTDWSEGTAEVVDCASEWRCWCPLCSCSSWKRCWGSWFILWFPISMSRDWENSEPFRIGGSRVKNKSSQNCLIQWHVHVMANWCARDRNTFCDYYSYQSNALWFDNDRWCRRFVWLGTFCTDNASLSAQWWRPFWTAWNRRAKCKIKAWEDVFEFVLSLQLTSMAAHASWFPSTIDKVVLSHGKWKLR